jgi:hypothetical protein
MTEIKTAPLAATHVPDKETFLRRRIPGSYRFTEPDADGELSFWYCCPCGCKAVAPLIAGKGFKPSAGPSWQWNGMVNTPTLEPSVNHIGHWHGWLRNGVWESC